MTKLSSLLGVTVALATFAVTLAAAPAVQAGNGFAAGPGHNPRPRPTKSTYECGGDLGYMKRVYADDIDGVEDASIVPICEDDDYGLMRSEGNAGAIRQHIADNEDIMDALDAANFRVEDVIAVRMTGDESAIIYVHTFHYR